MRFRALVIGLGHAGYTRARAPRCPKPATYVEMCDAHPRVVLAGVCDTDDDARAAYAGPARRFGDPRAALADVRPHLLCIATPTETHRTLTELAAATLDPPGVIVCESPLARIPEDADAMVDACRRRGVHLLVNHRPLFHPAVQRLVRAARAWRLRAATMAIAGGLWSTWPDAVSLLLGLAGESPSAVTAPLDGETESAAVLRFSTGGWATIAPVSRVTYPALDLVAYFDRAVGSITGSGPDVHCHRLVAHRWFAASHEPSARHTTCTRGLARSPMAPLAAHVVQLLTTRRASVSSGAQGATVVRVVAAIERAVASGGTIRVERVA